jgi:hypothetical protein
VLSLIAGRPGRVDHWFWQHFPTILGLKAREGMGRDAIRPAQAKRRFLDGKKAD